MKKILSLLIFGCFTTVVFSQTPFTIHNGNFPIYGAQLLSRTPSPVGSNLAQTANGSWDLSGNQGIQIIPSTFYQETDPFYTNAGIDVYFLEFKSLNANLGYNIFYEYDFQPFAVEEKGIYVEDQRYGLGALTGNPNDSLVFPFQGAVYTSGRKLMKFPTSYQSGWQSKSRRVVNFNLTVNAAGLINTPMQHVYTIHRTDTIVAWGKMRIYANGAPSIQYDVLINRNNQYAIDSFLIGAQPAPAALLAPFGMTQGQQTGFANRYFVYREGQSTPLAQLNFGANNFTNAVNLFTDTQNLVTSDVASPLQTEFITMLYPNPSASGTINLQIMGDVPGLSTYQVSDLQGRIVQSGKAELFNETLSININQLPHGSYVLQMLDDKKQTIITEQFMVQQQ